MGNSISCFDTVREHPPYSWPKDHPGRAAAIEERRRVRKNQKIVGSQGNARTIARDPTQPIEASPLIPADQQQTPMHDDALRTTLAEEDKEKIGDEKKEVTEATEMEDGQQDREKEGDKEEDVTEVVDETEIEVEEQFVEKSYRDALLENTVGNGVDDENGDIVDGLLDAENEEYLNEDLIYEDRSEHIENGNEEENGEDNGEIIDKDIGISATAVDESMSFDDDTNADDDDEVEDVDVDDVVNEEGIITEEEIVVQEQIKEQGVIDEEARSIDTRKAMFDNAEDELPEVKEKDLRRDVLDPVTKEHVSLEEYRKRQMERAQGVVKERVDKFEEIDDERSRQLAEHAAIEASRAEAIHNANWRFKQKPSTEGTGEHTAGVRDSMEAALLTNEDLGIENAGQVGKPTANDVGDEEKESDNVEAVMLT